jgi:hypothetical protein
MLQEEIVISRFSIVTVAAALAAVAVALSRCASRHYAVVIVDADDL